VLYLISEDVDHHNSTVRFLKAGQLSWFPSVLLLNMVELEISALPLG
jgi:hypothetical protein